jgi:hypothetical protein
MMPIEIAERGPVLGEADVAAFEARIGCVLPSDYRAFLLVYNGGVPEHHIIRNPGIGDMGVQLFFGIRKDENFDIIAENQTMRGRWPSRLLSIAIGDCGDRFCLSLGPRDAGRIYFWFHEEEAEEDEEPTELNLYPLANSFAEFWERIEPIDPDEFLAEADSPMDAESQRPSSDVPPPTTNGTPS